MSQQSKHREVEETLSSLDQLGKAIAPMHFEDKLYAKLNNVVQEKGKTSISPWMRWSAAALLALSVTNVFVIYQMESSLDETDVQSIWADPSSETYYGEEILTIIEP